MKVSNAALTPAKPLDPNHFTGDGRLHDFGTWDAQQAGMLVVHFEAGARNHWHRHPGGQVLFVTDGAGRVATREREVEVSSRRSRRDRCRGGALARCHRRVADDPRGDPGRDDAVARAEPIRRWVT